MENILKRLEYKIFKKYEKRVGVVTDYVWDYKFYQTKGITQLEHNETLNKFVLYYMKEFNLDVVITSGEICTIFENFDNFYVIGEDDVYNYKRYKSDIKEDFEPFFLIKEGGDNIGVVIKTNFQISPHHIILTNTDGSDYKIIDVWKLPSIKLIDCFKK
jgi:hypothetical protein